MEKIFLPTLHTFAMNNVFTGSSGPLRFRVAPTVVKKTPKEVDMEASSMFGELWHGIFCYEKSEIEAKEEFPLTEETRSDHAVVDTVRKGVTQTGIPLILHFGLCEEEERPALAAKLVSDDALFFLINSYTTGLSPLTMTYLLDLQVKKPHGGRTEAGELGLRVSATGSVLPCGASARWQRE